MFLIITVVLVSASCVSVSAAVVALLSAAAAGCLNSKRVSHPPLQLLGPLQLPTRTTPFCGCCLPDADAVAAASEAEAGDDDVVSTTIVAFFPPLPLPFRSWVVPPLDRSPALDLEEHLLVVTTSPLALPVPVDDDGCFAGDGKGRHAACSLGGVGTMGRGDTNPRLRAIHIF